MELQVQELLKKIKDEGIAVAHKESQAIIAEAEKKANSMIALAEKRAEEAEASAKARIEAMERASKLALVHASRDSLLGLKEKVGSFVKDMVKASTVDTLDAAFLKLHLPAILQRLAEGSSANLEVLVSPRQLSEFDSAFANRLSKDLAKGVQFKPFASVDAGFRVSLEGGNAHYDFSAEALSSIMAARVNATLADCIAAALAKD
ncbi:MAG: V-type H+-transporting ATPase subunit E [Spirochaetes bacterium]|nr:MAG: V-type H+-transporting ATPase subunit E [Spirochaetota bacterium]